MQREKRDTMRYFVIGATGFIGEEVARQLVATGHQVVALARDSASARGLAGLGVAVAQGGATERESLRALEERLPDALRWEGTRLGFRPKW